MKKILFGLIVIFSFNNFRTARPVKDHGQLQVIGTQLCDEKVNPVVLRGMSFGWHNWWPLFYNAGSVKWLVDDWVLLLAGKLKV